MRLPITQTTRTSNYKKKILFATERHLHKTDFWQGPGITKKQKKMANYSKWKTYWEVYAENFKLTF